MQLNLLLQSKMMVCVCETRMKDGKFYDVSSQPGGKYNEHQGSSFTLSLSRKGRLPKSLKVGEADGCYHHLSLTRSKNECTIKKKEKKEGACKTKGMQSGESPSLRSKCQIFK